MSINLTRCNYDYKYPVERIAAYVYAISKKYPDVTRARALDFGFGGGRHLRVLAELGFDTYGIDVTQDALDTTLFNYGEGNCPVPKEKLIIDNIMEHSVFPELYFDVIVSVEVLWSLGYDSLIGFMDKLIPLIKNGGYLITNFRTKFDYWYMKEENRVNHTDAKVDGFGYPWTFLSLQEVEELMKQYNMQITDIERYDRYFKNIEQDSYWQLVAQKVK